ncbi:TKL protein kinase [Phytophthora nicotianae P10297]|uniref:TKL protein kinase n=3 Tax=Phytophthora nicotianae TaxID=4792 RepID=V9FIW1_PHYNI|nr:TKL protein kinase [Phytophthora nicotianae P1569]ETM50354.1 TKL protein kinase [Phytophthora nicotianae]ETP48395.1 TKL protein kinase [Phytophthora nicotianae P10297]
MLHQQLLLVVVLGTVISMHVAAVTYEVHAWYSGLSCDGTPYNVFVMESFTCQDAECIADPSTSSTNLGALNTICTSDYMKKIQELFGNSPYIVMEAFRDYDCIAFNYAMGYFASGNCEGSPGFSDFAIATLEDDGSASVFTYDAGLCPVDSLNSSFFADKEALEGHSCDYDGNRWYSSNNNKITTPAPTPALRASTSKGLSTAAAIGITSGVFILVIVLGVFIFCWRRRSSDTKSRQSPLQPTESIGSIQTPPFIPGAPHRHTTGLWDDDVIITKRIPRDKVRIQTRISQGAFGEVYTGMFNGRQVAVKMLLPSMRENLQLVNQFLGEAKMTAAMDHPNVVTFIGVAWDSLSDVCVVLEYMDGGDLRFLLSQYEAKHQPVGFNRQKATIALQVCHALAYLHSLIPPVVHRDLKSRNILLSRSMEAKLTDFGISKERLDTTLTAGVGTSLWMAPEVMLGEYYDDKADIFSFGVVLSELDVHTLPYTNARKGTRDPYGREVTDTALMQQVASGKVQVEFSKVGPPSITQLGYVCVAIDPSLRPSAAEILYRLQTILAHEL